METTKVSPIPPAHHKEKQKIKDNHSTYHRTTSYNGDYKSMVQHARNDHHSKSKYLEPNYSRDLNDQGAPSEKVPSLVVDSPEHKTRKEEPVPPLPPPEITSASVMVVVTLKNATSDLLEAIRMYETFDEICHDSPAWEYFVTQEVFNIKTSLRSMHRLARYILHLRKGGQGTVECGELENLVKGVFQIEKEGSLEWRETASKITEKHEPKKSKKHDELKGEDGVKEKMVKLREEQNKTYRHYLNATYVKKMKTKLGQLEAVADEVDTLKGQLKTSWGELSKLTEEELDDMEDIY